MNRRVIGLIAAAVLAVVGVIVLVAFVNGAEDRKLEGQEVVDVLVLEEPVNAGTPSEQLSDKVETRKVPRDVVTSQAVSDLSQISGLVAAVNLLPGDQVSAARFVTQAEFQPSRSTVEVPDGLAEITISLNPEETIGGTVNPGDKVALIASFDGDAACAPCSAFLLEQVLVTNVQGDQTPTTDENGETLTATDRAAAIASNLLITFAVKPEQLERMVYVQRFGQLYLALEDKDVPVVPVNPQTPDSIIKTS